MTTPPLLVPDPLPPAEAARLEMLANAAERLTRVIGDRFRELYDGKRDIFKAGGYPTSITFEDYLKLYERGGVAGAVVDKIAEATWRRAPEISDDDGRTDTAFAEAWQALAERLRLWSALEAVDKQSRIGRYAVLYLGTNAVDRALAQPLARGATMTYVQAFDEGRAQISRWNADPTSPSFGLPDAYTIQAAGTLDGFAPAVTSLNVHASRVIHVAEGLLRDRVYGRPALKRPYNDLMDYQKVVTSTAEAFWQRVVGIIQGRVDKDATLTTAEQQAYAAAVQDVMHGLGRFVAQKGITLEALAQNEPDPETTAKLLERRIAAATEYPVRVLFGSETGERASTEDMKAYLGTVAERQRTHVEPTILRPLIDRLISVGILPRPMNGRYDVVWPSLFEVPETEIAEANRARAETARALTPVGGDPLALVEIDEQRNVWLIPREPGTASPFAPTDPEPMPTEADDDDDDDLEDDDADGLQPSPGDDA